MAVLVVAGVTLDGRREILAVEPMLHESEATYTALFRSLKERGLEKVWLCVSDAHYGLRTAVKKSFLGCSWQRCKVHFMRNIIAHVSRKEKASFAKKLKNIWTQPTREAALRTSRAFIEEYGTRFPEAIGVLQDGLEDSLQYYAFDRFDFRKISSTNLLERLNEEIRRRTRVVGIFPGADSYLRLVVSYLMEYAEDWATGKSYISPVLIEEQQSQLKMVA